MKSDRIKNWPKEERPREKLLAEGAYDIVYDNPLELRDKLKTELGAWFANA